MLINQLTLIYDFQEMPIYEFYCADCHAVFSFLARKPDTEKRPKCPRCGRPNLHLKVSRFAISKGRSEPRESDELPAYETTQSTRCPSRTSGTSSLRASFVTTCCATGAERRRFRLSNSSQPVSTYTIRIRAPY